MKHVRRASHNSSVNKRIVSEYTSQIMQTKYVLIKKGFGQGMGATNAQNQDEVNLVWGWNGKFVRKSNEFKACLEG